MNTLVNFESALLGLNGQFSVGGNTPIAKGSRDLSVEPCVEISGKRYNKNPLTYQSIVITYHEFVYCQTNPTIKLGDKS